MKLLVNLKLWRILGAPQPRQLCSSVSSRPQYAQTHGGRNAVEYL